jgi:hypothetical protein
LQKSHDWLKKSQDVQWGLDLPAFEHIMRPYLLLPENRMRSNRALFSAKAVIDDGIGFF